MNKRARALEGQPKGRWRLEHSRGRIKRAPGPACQSAPQPAASQSRKFRRQAHHRPRCRRCSTCGSSGHGEHRAAIRKRFLNARASVEPPPTHTHTHTHTHSKRPLGQPWRACVRRAASRRACTNLSAHTTSSIFVVASLARAASRRWSIKAESARLRLAGAAAWADDLGPLALAVLPIPSGKNVCRGEASVAG